MPKIVSIFTLVILLSGCQYFQFKTKKENALARVEETYLYLEDLEGIVPKGADTQDSIALINQFINSWIHEQLLLNRAEMNLDKDLKDFDKQLEEYRKSLIIYTYQQRFVEQQMDTTVRENEIETYYRENPADFELRENILIADYLVFLKKHKDAAKIKAWFRSDKEEAKEKLHHFTASSSLPFNIGDTNWVRFDELLKIIPLPADNQELFLSTRKYVEIEDSSFCYLLNIKDYKIKEMLSPLVFEKNRIKSIILNIRKMMMLKKLEDDLYQEALQKKKFEIYTQ